MKRLPIFFFFFFWCHICAQNSFEWTKTVTVTQQFLCTDIYGNNYFLSNQILSKTKNQTSVSFNGLIYGDISGIDTQNPLKILVSYPTQNTAVILDNNLNLIQKIDWNSTGNNFGTRKYYWAEQNKIWIADANNKQIGLWDLGLQKFQKICNLQNFRPETFVGQMGSFFILDSQNNLWKGNIYGALTKWTTLPAHQGFLVRNNQNLFIWNNQDVFVWKNHNWTKLLLPEIEKRIESIDYQNEKLIIFTDRKIIEYKLNTK